MSEFFGANWPEQPIEFGYDGEKPPSATTRMLGPNGREVPFQWTQACEVSTAKSCILVRSYLPGNASYKWTLQAGVAPPALEIANAVHIATAGPNLEITNGLTGVRIATPASNGRPWNRAPIQGLMMAGRLWSGAAESGNLLYTENESSSGGAGAVLRTPAYTATGYTVTVVDAGPLKVSVRASYTFRRPQYAYGKTIINPAGPGHYTVVVTLYANSSSILIDEDSDMQFSYYLPVYAQLKPDQARYRGHDSIDGSGANSPVCGYETPFAVHDASLTSPVIVTAPASLQNGQRILIAGVQGNTAANGDYYAKTNGYPAGHFALFSDARLTAPVAASGAYTSGGMVKAAYRGSFADRRSDGYLDITYNGDRSASYFCGPNSYRKLMADYGSAAHSAGFYLTLYNSAAGPKAPVIGIFTGRASRQIYSAVGPSLPGLYSSDKHWISGQKDAGIEVENLLRSPDASTTRLVHRNWAVWTGTQADLLPPYAHQPIGTEQNALTGINLSHLYTYQLEYPDPPGGWKWLYLSAKGAGEIISAVKNGTPTCGSLDCYYRLLAASEGSPFGASLLTLWREENGAGVQKALNAAVALARGLCDALALGDNHFDSQHGYYALGLHTSPQTAVINAILMDPYATPAQKRIAKAALALFGSVLWDNDWFPIDNDSGEGYGLANQVQQYLQYRAQSVAAAPSQPYLASKLAAALTYPVNDFNRYFSATGAASGSTHYQSAFFEPLILNYESFSRDGALSMADPKWVAYANWELSIQTPPEPRFGNLRKGYSNGNGNTEADVRTGMLATAMYPANPVVAGNLMWAWQQSNSPTHLTEDVQFVTTLAVIDPAVPAVKPHLGSINIPGYHSVERYGFGTPDETVLWFINGGFYSQGGHRHDDDGQVSIYADSAPLSIDWNANLYYPDTPGRFMHNAVVYDSEMKRAWDADNGSMTEPALLLRNPSNTEFEAFPNSTTAVGTFNSADGTKWTRSVRTMAFNSAYPAIYVKDTFGGPAAAAGKTLTWNMMAGGPVSTPAGVVTPITRFSPACQSPAGQLPSSGGVYPLAAGLQRFTFRGLVWPRHAAGGIDWDLFTLSADSTGRFLIGNWGHGCHPSREAAEFTEANGKPFSESQHILRVHDTGSFTTIMLPYKKTAPPARTVSQKPCGVEIVQADETTCFSDAAARYSRGTARHILTVYDKSEQAAFGLRLTGGSQEVMAEPERITWTLSGVEAGQRSLTLPGNWYPNRTVAHTGQTFTYDFPGGAQTEPVTILFSPTPR